MVAASDIPRWLFDASGEYIYYENSRATLHVVNGSALIVWNLRLRTISPPVITQFLEACYGLHESPSREVDLVIAWLAELGLVQKHSDVSDSLGPIPEVQLWGSTQKAIQRARDGIGWDAPSLRSFPFDGLEVSSAKCSSRWANLDDNTCYRPNARDA